MSPFYTIGCVLILAGIVSKGSCLSCYQCDSTLDSNCQENWNHKLQINQQKYRDCNLWDAKHCIKVTGMWGGVVGTHRFCSSRDMGDQCQDIWFPDHDRLYRACVYTCNDDGCNSAPFVSVSAVVVFVSVAGNLMLTLFR